MGQYIIDPRQQLFFQYYTSRSSPTFSDATRSAMAAGYDEEYARNLVSRKPRWFSDAIRQMDLLDKSEQALNELLTQDEDLKVKAQVAMFIAKGAGKDRWQDKQKIALEFEQPKEFAPVEDIEQVLSIAQRNLEERKKQEEQQQQEGV